MKQGISAFQILLRAISVVLLVVGALIILMGVSYFSDGGYTLGYQAPLEMFSEIAQPLFLVLGILILVEGVVDVLAGLSGLTAASDAYRVGPFLAFSIIELLLAIAGFVLSILNAVPSVIAINVVLFILMAVCLRLALGVRSQTRVSQGS